MRSGARVGQHTKLKTGLPNSLGHRYLLLDNHRMEDFGATINKYKADFAVRENRE